MEQESANQENVVCKSFFISGEDNERKYRFTQKWIEYINQTEINKGRNLPKP